MFWNKSGSKKGQTGAQTGASNGEKAKNVKKKPGKDASLWSRIWYFIWYDDSALSWIVNIILAYLIIKFIFYPGIGLLFGTSYPIVAVVSSSMEHQGGFDQWWAENEDYYLEFNITKADFEDYPFQGGFNRGDIMVLVGREADDIRIGDVIVFQSGKPYPIIHRVIVKEDKGMWVFQTKGDNNKGQIRDSELDETRVLEKSLLGKAVIRVPWLGYVKIWFVEAMNAIGFNIT